MIHFHATRKVLNTSRIEPVLLVSAPTPDRKLADWYVDLVPTGFAGKFLLLFVHLESHLSILVKGKSLRNAFPEFHFRLQDRLKRAGFPQDWILNEYQYMEGFTSSKTSSRSMLAHINQIKYSLEYHLLFYPSYDSIDLHKMEILLLDECFFQKGSKKYVTPKLYWEAELGVRLSLG